MPSAKSDRREQAEWLHAVAIGVVTPVDVIRSASSVGGTALQRLSLRALLTACYSRRRSDEILSRVSRLLGAKLAGKRISIRWLLGDEARYRALLDVLGSDEPETLSRRFPYD